MDTQQVKRFFTNKYVILLTTIIVLDQVFKWLSRRVAPLRLFPFLNIAKSQNTGIAFGMLQNIAGANLIFLIVSLIAIVCMFYLFFSEQLGNKSRLGVIVMIGGAIANLLDRLIHGYVIDFIDFHIGSWHFATFNLADAAISIGAIIVIFYLFKEEKAMAVQKLGPKKTDKSTLRKSTSRKRKPQKSTSKKSKGQSLKRKNAKHSSAKR